jgi:hypothetical protein
MGRGLYLHWALMCSALSRVVSDSTPANLLTPVNDEVSVSQSVEYRLMCTYCTRGLPST